MPPHGLKTLSVGNLPEAVGWKQKLSITAFLDTLFTKLERVETQGGVNSLQWACIYDSGEDVSD